MRYRFVDFLLDTRSQELLGPGGLIALRPQAYDVLLRLLQAAPEVVSKDELLDSVWGHRAISDSALAQVIKELRAALGESAEDPRIIVTRHRRGYQIAAAIEQIDPEEFAPPLGDPPALGNKKARDIAWMPLAAGVLAVAAAAAWFGWPRGPAGTPTLDNGWPINPVAKERTELAMDAVRRYALDDALPALKRARELQSTPRLDLTQAMVHTIRGERSLAEAAIAGVRARLPELSRTEQILLEAAEHRLAGRDHLALDRYHVLSEMFPQDVDFAMALFGLQRRLGAQRWDGAEATYGRLSDSNRVPAPRQLLLSAQLAGVQRNFEQQVSQARAVMLTCESECPALAALARYELGLGLRHLGQIEDAIVEFGRAGTALERMGLLRPASHAWRWQATLSIRSGDLDAAEAGIESLDQRLQALGDPYLRAELKRLRGHIASQRGAEEQALNYFSAAATEFARQRNDRELASTLMSQAGPLRRLSRADDAREVLQRALALADQSHNEVIRGQILGSLASLYTDESRYDEAIKYGEQALSEFRRLRSRNSEGIALINLAITHSQKGDVAAQKEHTEQAIEFFHELNRKPLIALSSMMLAFIAMTNGDLDLAEFHGKEAEQAYRVLENHNRGTMATILRARIRLYRADLAGAVEMLRQTQPTETLSDESAAAVLTMQGTLARYGADWATARSRFEQALEARTRRDDLGLMRASRLDLARLDIDEGRYAGAEQIARQAATEARGDGADASERDARLILAAALIGQGRNDRAVGELDTVSELLAKAPSFVHGLEAAVLKARADTSPDDSAERLDWVLAQAAPRGYRLFELEARGFKLRDGPIEQQLAWESEVRESGLAYLLGPSLVLGGDR